MAHVFRVKHSGENGRTVAYVLADSKAKARAAAVSDIEAERLSSADMIAVMSQGIAIVDAETGKVVNAQEGAE